MHSINKNDNVALCLEENGSIPFGHKVALTDIKKGEAVIKYGFPIGASSKDIKKGDWVHLHNLKTALTGEARIEFVKNNGLASNREHKSGHMTFMGYEREDKSAGVRNELWVIPTVGCVNESARKIAERFNQKFSDLEGFDGAVALCHQWGCSQTSADQDNTRAILKGLAKNPNAAAVLFLGLGCENSGVEFYKDDYKKPVSFLVCQEVNDEVDEGLRLLEEMISTLPKERKPIDISKLVIGLKCGGSDSLSGITANPLIGQVCDNHIENGGSAALTEVPEMFGAEQVLAGRISSPEVFDKFTRLIGDFRDYYTSHGERVSENPSPGNNEGGITTLEEKSLGCVTKGGTSEIIDVLGLGQQVEKAGVSLVFGPGNDIVACTNLAAAGCQIILFSTGRGTPLGTVVPTVKISSNSKIASLKPKWIDFDGYSYLTDRSAKDKLYKMVLEVCSGKRAKNEENGYREISLFKTGVIL